MQKILYSVVLVAASLTACKNSDKSIDAEPPKMVTVSNTEELEEFMEWKEQKLAKEKQKTTSYTAPARKATKTVTKRATAPKTVSTQPAPVITEPIPPIPTEAEKKKGWSKAAKGAAIGAGVGAAAGAIIVKKNRVLGGVIGGVVGGGVGYGIGRSMDKKDGRY